MRPEGVGSGAAAGIGAQRREVERALARRRRHLDPPGRPELLEVRQLHALAAAGSRASSRRSAAPTRRRRGPRRTPRGTRAARPARRASRSRCTPRAGGATALVHRRDPRIGPAGRDVVALERRGRGEDDVGEARDGVPPRLVHDHGLGPPPGAREAVQVLMVVERVAAAPVDEPDVGERDALAVVVDLAARARAARRRCARRGCAR